MKPIFKGCLLFFLAGIFFFMVTVFVSLATEKVETSFLIAAALTLVVFYFIGKHWFRKKLDKPLQKNSLKLKAVSMGDFKTWRELDVMLAGSQFADEKGTLCYKNLKDIQELDEVNLVREPSNKYDKNAIAVTFNGLRIGYLPRKYSRWLSLQILQGRNVHSYFKKTLTQGDYPIPVIIVELERTKDFK